MSFHRAVSFYGDLDSEDQPLEKITSDSRDMDIEGGKSLDQIMQFKKEIKVIILGTNTIMTHAQ